MSVILHDLAAGDDGRFSPFCWRARMALAHKGLDVDARGTRFCDIANIADGSYERIPVIEDRGKIVNDSFAIADYLEKHYPDAPSLFGDERGRTFALFMNNWANAVMMPAMAPLIIADIYERLDPADKDYFKTSREARFGRPLAEVQAGRDTARDAFVAALYPLRATLEGNAYLGGETPFYGDYPPFAVLQWARVISPFKIFEADDVITQWFERCLDLYDGLGRAMPAANG